MIKDLYYGHRPKIGIDVSNSYKDQTRFVIAEPSLGSFLCKSLYACSTTYVQDDTSNEASNSIFNFSKRVNTWPPSGKELAEPLLESTSHFVCQDLIAMGTFVPWHFSRANNHVYAISQLA